MTVEDRKRIDFLLQLGWTPAQIAEDRGRSKSTILHEIINRSVPCERGYRCSNRICALFDACPRTKGYGREAKRSFNCTPRCFEVCPDFVERTCARVFNMLWRLAGPELFQRLFFVILTDNGSEFSDPDMIEKWRPDPEHNPTKLLPRGIHLFYCDAYCSSQKPHVEREHCEERRVLLHGVSFDTLTQDDVNLVASHVASYSRGVLDNRTPYDTFLARFGEQGKNLLDALDIVKIPPNEVTLDPILLGEKFKRHADGVILMKAGALPPKKPEGLE